VHDGESIFIAEKNNRCIRAMSGQNIQIICGTPPSDKKHTRSESDSLYNPTKLLLDQNILYVLDEDYIKSLPKSSHNNVASIAHTQGAIAMSMDGKKNLIWMRLAND
jgi:hypothetical protein